MLLTAVPRLWAMKVITITDDGQPRLSKTERQRNRRATGSGVPLPPLPTDRPGPCEAGVIAECADLPLASERPATVLMAQAMARILDDDRCMGMWPQASRALMAKMAALRPKASRNPKRLAAVRMMSK
jgi:hypothetical protein